MQITNKSSSSFEGHPLQVRHKQDWGRGFILLLPQAAVLPGSDAGSDVIKPASSFVIQKLTNNNKQVKRTIFMLFSNLYVTIPFERSSL